VQSYKSPNIYQIPVELIKAGRGTLLSEILKHVNYIWWAGGGILYKVPRVFLPQILTGTLKETPLIRTF